MFESNLKTHEIQRDSRMHGVCRESDLAPLHQAGSFTLVTGRKSPAAQ